MTDSPRTPFEAQLDEMGGYVTRLRHQHGLKAQEAVNLLSLVLNYNITVKQMGLTGTAPQIQEGAPDGSQN